MGRGDPDLSKLLRWYPATWRARYGDELLALVEDELGGDPPPLRTRLSLAGAGLRERARGAGLVGDSAPASVRRRTGALAILVSWTTCSVGGMAFAKAAEHFRGALSAGTRALPGAAYDAVAAAALAGATLVGFAVLVVVGPFVRFLAHGGWTVLRGHLLRAALATLITVATFVPALQWAHRLTFRQRNGGDFAFGVIWLLLATAIVATLYLWTTVAVSAGRRLELSPPGQRFVTLCALGVVACLVVVVAAVVTWWIAMAVDGPSFFAAPPRPGARGTPWTPQLLVAAAFFGLALLAAGYGSVLVARSPLGRKADVDV